MTGVGIPHGWGQAQTGPTGVRTCVESDNRLVTKVDSYIITAKKMIKKPYQTPVPPMHHPVLLVNWQPL